MPREKANSISAQSPACRETTCLGLCLRIWEQATISALAQPGAGRLALLGAGAQGRSHLEAIALIRRLTDVAVWDAHPENAQKFAAEMAKSTGCPIRICSSAEEAARDADIICTLTPSPTPILESGWVQPGAHINAVGACSATTRELNSALVARCRLYGDSIESVEKESGDYLIPLSEGAIQKEHLLGTIGQLCAARLPAAHRRRT